MTMMLEKHLCRNSWFFDKTPANIQHHQIRRKAVNRSEKDLASH